MVVLILVVVAASEWQDAFGLSRGEKAPAGNTLSQTM
jgi:hypothetical protein